MRGQPRSLLPRQRRSGVAVASLALGVLGLPLLGLTSIPAVICGHLARASIRESNGRLSGSELARIGLIAGYASLALLVFAIAAGLLRPILSSKPDAAELARTTAQLRELGAVCQLYALKHDGSFPPKLEDLVPRYLADAQGLACRFPDPKRTGTFEYRGGRTSDPANAILVATPDGGRAGRLFLQVNGRVVYKSRTEILRENTPQK